jgi:hypothetical protein
VQGFIDFKIEEEYLCKGCALSKHIEDDFPSSEHISRKSLDIIHSYVCGSMSSTYLTGS